MCNSNLNSTQQLNTRIFPNFSTSFANVDNIDMYYSYLDCGEYPLSTRGLYKTLLIYMHTNYTNTEYE